MKRTAIILFVIAPCLITGIEGNCQSPIFSQYYSSALYLNPALTGLEKDPYLGLNYRSQWSRLNLPFNTFQFSFIQPITQPGAKKKHLGGLGITFLNDVAGANKEFVTRSFSLAGAYNFHLNRHGNNIIAAALQIGASMQRVNFDGLRWTSQYSSLTGFDQSLPGEASLTNDRLFNPIINTGIMWYYTNKQRNRSYLGTSYYNGLSVSNLLPGKGYYLLSKEGLSMIYKVHGGLSSVFNRQIDLSPNYLFQLQDNNFQFNLGMYVGYSITNPTSLSITGSTKVLLGVWYRLQDSIIISTGLSNAVWNVGFSYDCNTSSLSKAFGFGSAFEFSLAYKVVNNNGYKRFSSPLI
jgi:type IX secretion system PorP/SprF family membrane protein